MKKILRYGYLPPVYVLMLLVIFILPLFSVNEYSILENTTSHLGAQGAPYSWVMNLVFVLLGAASVADAWKSLSGYWLHKAVILVFGVSLVLTAFFQHAPIVPDAAYSVIEDDLHSKLATATGFSFTFFAVSAAFIESTLWRRAVAAGMGVAAVVLSMLIFNVTGLAGIWQRTIFLTMFAWLIFFLNTFARHD